MHYKLKEKKILHFYAFNCLKLIDLEGGDRASRACAVAAAVRLPTVRVRVRGGVVLHVEELGGGNIEC